MGFDTALDVNWREPLDGRTWPNNHRQLLEIVKYFCADVPITSGVNWWSSEIAGDFSKGVGWKRGEILEESEDSIDNEEPEDLEDDEE
jgi:hypothetical protein